MTEKRINPSDVIGKGYYIYHLSSSNYTPSLNGSITITCTVYNIYDETVPNKSVTLYQNGTSKGAKTTNNNGVATWTITCSTGGLQRFNIEDTSIEVFVDNKSEVGHTHSQYLTEHQSLTNYVTTSDSRLSDARTPTSHSHGNLQNNGQVGSTAQANKNVVTNSSGLITTEDKPTIPSASSTTPSADTTSGSVGTGTTWARSNHTHPKSSLYAEASHTHSGYLTSHQDISGKEDTSNKLTSLQSLNDLSTDTQYPSAKLVYTYWSDLDDRLQNNYPLSSDLGAVAFSNDYTDLDNLPSFGNLAFENDVDLSGHDLDELSDNTNLLFSGDYDDLDNKPTIPTQTSQLTNNSGFITSSSLSNYLQQSDVKDNLTSTDTNKPLSANQGKELKELIDEKIDLDCEFINGYWNTNNANRISGTSVKDTNTLKQDGKTFIYKVPDFSNMTYSGDLYLGIVTTDYANGIGGRIYHNDQTLSIETAKTLILNKYVLFKFIQNGNFNEYHILKIWNIFHNHNDSYYNKTEIDGKIGVYVEKADLNNNSLNIDSLFADMIDYGMNNDSEW